MIDNNGLESGIGNDCGLKKQILPVNEESPIRREMLEDAALLASLLIDRGNIAKVGIAGSLVRGKEDPSDIDLIIFVDNETAKRCQMDKMKFIKSKSSVEGTIKLYKYLTLDDHDWNRFALSYNFGLRHPVDIIVVSSDPDENYAKIMADENLDPSFLENISNDVFLYNSSIDGFVKENVFNKQEKDVIRQASDRRLKEILKNPNHAIYGSIERSHNHAKRIKYLKGSESIEEDSSYKFEIDTVKVDKGNSVKKYEGLIKSFDEDLSLEKWREVVSLVGSEIEDFTESGFYDRIPFLELEIIGNRLFKAKTREDRYKILMEENSNGELWYDIILGHVNDKMFQPLVDQLELLTRYGSVYEKALDIGCGSGNSLKMMAPFCSECVGLDKLDFVLDTAKKNNLPENVIDLVNGDATNLPFGDDSFDLVVSNGLTCYLTTNEVRKYVNEVNRVLKIGGEYMETVVNINEGSVLSEFEEGYLSSAKSALVCFLDRLCSSDKGIEKTEGTITVLINEFKKFGFYIEFPGFKDNNIGVLRFVKR